MTDQQSSTEYTKQRHDMVDNQLIAHGITDERLLSIMRELPREMFLPEIHQNKAYEDHPISIGLDQTISQPYMLAIMTQLLAVSATHRVLEIGTGSGYQTAILASLAAQIITIERHSHLRTLATERLAQLKYENVEFVLADGSIGSREHAPFDRILVTAAGPAIPDALRSQLTEGGRLVMPVGDAKDQTLYCLQRQGNRYHLTRSIPCRFVKLIGQQGWPVPTTE